MHVSFALFADAANLSQEGKLNILGVFDAVHVPQFPALHPRATIVVRLKGSASDVGTHPMTLRWQNPKGVELWSSTADLGIQAPPSPAGDMDLPVIVQVDLPLDMTGAYRLVVELDGTPCGSAQLHVHSDHPAPPISFPTSPSPLLS